MKDNPIIKISEKTHFDDVAECRAQKEYQHRRLYPQKTMDSTTEALLGKF